MICPVEVAQRLKRLPVGNSAERFIRVYFDLKCLTIREEIDISLI